MTTLTTYLQATINKIANYIGHMVLRLLVLVAVAAGVLALGNATGVQVVDTVAVQVPRVETAGTDTHDVPPAAQDCAPSPGELFNPCATLDTTTVDDERTDPVARCLALDGVTMPDGQCVEASFLWAYEVDTATWNGLLDYGFPVDLHDHDRMIVPAGMLILSEDTVVGVDFSAPVQPMLVG